MQRITGYAAYVAGTEAELQRICQPAVDLFEKSYPTLMDVMSGNAKGRTDDEQKTFLINDGTQR